MTETELVQPRSASYSALAAEYYDSRRHPTCSNFRWASDRLLRRLLPNCAGSLLCEVGAGDSALAAILCERGQSLSNLLITDASAGMLEHSRRWYRGGAQLALARASSLPLADGSVDLVVASLADAYNNEQWWPEVGRVLSAAGRAIMTTPTHSWATAFRTATGQPMNVARFDLVSGTSVDVPSWVREPAAERALIHASGMRVVEQEAMVRRDFPSSISPKIHALEPDTPVVMAYVVAF